MSQMRSPKRKLHFFHFYVWRPKNRKKKKENGKGQKNPIKLVFKVVIQKCEDQKGIFTKNCLTLFVSGREKKRIFVHTICFGQKFFWTKTVQSRKHYKNRAFSGNCKKAKMTPFWEKGVF